jgi:hypothetical protein
MKTVAVGRRELQCAFNGPERIRITARLLRQEAGEVPAVGIIRVTSVQLMTERHAARQVVGVDAAHDRVGDLLLAG